MNLLILGYSAATTETSRNAFSTNQGTNQDDSQSDPHPEACIFHNHRTRNSGPEDGHDTVTGNHEAITYCSPSTSSGKQKKNRPTSQPQLRSGITPATVKVDQIMLALQQLANNNNSANFHNNFNRISKLPESLTTTTPKIDGKSEKFELLEDLFQTNLKIHNQLTGDERINYFQSLMRGDA